MADVGSTTLPSLFSTRARNNRGLSKRRLLSIDPGNNTAHIRQHIKHEMDKKLEQLHVQSEREESFRQTLKKMPAASMSTLRANALGLTNTMMTFKGEEEKQGEECPEDDHDHHHLHQSHNSVTSTSSSSSSSLGASSMRRGSSSNIWYHRYKEERDRLWAERLKKYEVNEMAQKGWRRGLIKPKPSAVNPDADFRPPPPLSLWHRTAWPANFFCELCMGVSPLGPDVLTCTTCNVVFHCACFNHKMGGSKEDEAKLKSKDWHCTYCRWVIENEINKFEEYKKQRLGAMVRYKLIVRLQSNIRGWLCRQRYKKFLARLAKAQAIIRRYVTYHRFRRFVRKVTRLYKVRIIDIVDLYPLEANAPSSTFSIMLSIINKRRSSSIFVSPFKRRGSSSAETSRRRSTVTTIRDQDGKRHTADLEQAGQLYRFESTPFPHGDVRLNQTFYVPGCNQSVTMAFTVVRNGVIQEFWGQGFFEPSSLPGSRKMRVSIPLGDMTFAPREKRSLVPIKTRVLADKTVTGHVHVEIQQVPSYHGKCGLIHEVPKTGNKHEKTKVWWMALIDSHLFLYKNAGDAIPYQMISVIKVSWSDKVNIRVASLKGDDAIIFTQPDEVERQDWYNKIRNAAKSE